MGLFVQRPKGAHVPVDASGAWPIGSVFISVVSTNPATLLGFGTWSAFGAGRVLIGLDSGDTDFDTVEETGGAKTVSSSAQTFAGNASTVVVNHVHVQHVNSSASGGAGKYALDTNASGDATTELSTSDPTGGVATGTTAVNTAGATDTE